MESYEIQNMPSEFKYKFSIIMAVYNVEQFLREAIDSVIEQDIGFEQNVQLILVNDGSKDGSGTICDEYKEKYPDNIIVIHKGNGGVATARNEGLKYATGRYLNFMDSDDKFTEDVLSSVYHFFLRYEGLVDIVTIPMYLFDSIEGEYWQNYKFKKGARIIDLKEEYNALTESVSSSFINAQRKNDINFDSSLVSGEDVKVILYLLLNKMKLGVVTKGKYMYRRRSTGEKSRVQSAQRKHERYFEYFYSLIYWARDYYMFNIGYIPKYVQYIIGCELQWRFKEDLDLSLILNEEEIIKYKKLLFDALDLIDDKIILEQKMIWTEHKTFMLLKKHKSLPSLDVYKNDIQLFYRSKSTGDKIDLCWLSGNPTKIEFLKIEKNKLKIEGKAMFLGCLENEPINIYLLINDKLKECTYINREVNQYRLGELLYRGISFEYELKLNKNTQFYKIQIVCKFKNNLALRNVISFSEFCPIGNEYSNSYYYKNNYILTYWNSSIYISKCGKRGVLNRELKFLKELWKSKKESDKKAFYIRVFYHIFKNIVPRDIWLISDRINKADDNGEALFKYMNSLKKKKEKTYFIIEEKSSDYNNISKVGKVVKYLSYKHKLLYLFSNNVISSHADNYVTNPFQEYFAPYRDLMQKQKYVFLQHGVTKDNLSDWLNKYNKNIDIFVTTANPEYKSILDYNYYYSKHEVKLTGFPRHDFLYHNEKNYVTIMPTWRRYLMDSLSSNTGVWTCASGFCESEYFKFYNSLINNEYLLNTLEKYNYKLAFMPHPNIIPHIELFDKKPEVIFFDINKSYKEVFAESNIVITDYSSVAFDFAYLRKPIIYSQFDKNEFFSGEHVYTKGYFDYERDGFGEVEYTLEDTVKRVIEYIKNDCILKEKYIKRINRFFAFNDKNNCKRVYEAIKSHNKQE